MNNFIIEIQYKLYWCFFRFPPSEMTSTYQCSNHMMALKNNVTSLFENDKHADITFIVEGKHLKCHKNILASRSDYFNAMLQSPLTDEHQINIDTLSYDDFRQIIR